MTDEQIKQADQQRIQAMTQADRAQMEALFDNDLVWVHASAAIDTKVSMIAKFDTGALQVHGWSTLEETIRHFDGCSFASGSLSMDVTVDGNRRQGKNRFVSVWRRSGCRPTLLYWQSTRMPG